MAVKDKSSRSSTIRPIFAPQPIDSFEVPGIQSGQYKVVRHGGGGQIEVLQS